MVDQEQRWWFPLTVGLLLIAWGLNVWAPVAMLRPMWGGASQLVQMDDGSEAPPPPAPPSLWLPLVAMGLATITVAISVWQMYDERKLGGRWLWAAAASIGSISASWFAFKSLQRAAERFEELYGLLPM